MDPLGLRRLVLGLDAVRAQLDAGVPVALGLTLFDTFYLPDTGGRIKDPPQARRTVAVTPCSPSAISRRDSDPQFVGVLGRSAAYAWISDSYVRSHVSAAWIIDPSAGSGGSTGAAHTGAEEGAATYGSR